MKNFTRFVQFIIPLVLLAGCHRRGSRDEGHHTGYKIPDSVKVPLDEAYKMVANYAEKTDSVKHDGIVLPNTRSSWISLEHLEAYVKRLKSEKGDGLRLYFATYSDKYPDSTHEHYPPSPDRWGSNTLLMVSTRDSIYEGQHAHWDYFGPSNKKMPGFTAHKGILDRAPAENHTLDCPPNCIGNELLKPFNTEIYGKP